MMYEIIILHKKKVNNDLLIVGLSSKFGKVNFKLRARDKNALSASLDFFRLLRLGITDKGSWPAITSIEEQVNWANITVDLSKLNQGLYFLELTDKILPICEAEDGVFALLQTALIKLNTQPIDKKLPLIYALKLFGMLGYLSPDKIPKESLLDQVKLAKTIKQKQEEVLEKSVNSWELLGY